MTFPPLPVIRNLAWLSCPLNDEREQSHDDISQHSGHTWMPLTAGLFLLLLDVSLQLQRLELCFAGA